MKKPLITIAICTYRRFKYLYECLERVKDQSLQADEYEILVVDNSMMPSISIEFKNLLKGFKNLRYLITDKSGITYARNIAIHECRSPILLFTDDDVRVPNSWCRDFLETFRKYPSAGAIGGRVDPIWPNRPPAWLFEDICGSLAILNWPADKVISITKEQWLVTANCGYRLKALNDVGGFSEKLGRKGHLPFWHAEKDINHAIQQQGYDLLYSPFIKVEHIIEKMRLTKKWFFRQQFFGGASESLRNTIVPDDFDYTHLATQLDQHFNHLFPQWSFFNNKIVIKHAMYYFDAEGKRQCDNYLEQNSFKSMSIQPRNNKSSLNRHRIRQILHQHAIIFLAHSFLLFVVNKFRRDIEKLI